MEPLRQFVVSGFELFIGGFSDRLPDGLVGVAKLAYHHIVELAEIDRLDHHFGKSGCCQLFFCLVRIVGCLADDGNCMSLLFEKLL